MRHASRHWHDLRYGEWVLDATREDVALG